MRKAIVAVPRTFEHEKAACEIRSAIHVLHVLRFPEPHLKAYDKDGAADAWRNPYLHYPQFDVFKEAYTLKAKTRELQGYIGSVARFLQLEGEELRGDELRHNMVVFGENSADRRYDLPLWVDERDMRLSVDQILPEAELLDKSFRTWNRGVPCHQLEQFVGRSLDLLGDRYPSLPGLG